MIVSEAWTKEWKAPNSLANTKENIGHCGASCLHGVLPGRKLKECRNM